MGFTPLERVPHLMGGRDFIGMCPCFLYIILKGRCPQLLKVETKMPEDLREFYLTNQYTGALIKKYNIGTESQYNLRLSP